VLTLRVLGGLVLLCRTLPLLDELIRCQSDHDDYVCSHGGVAMSAGDGMNSNTQVPIAKRTWEPVVASCCNTLFFTKEIKPQKLII
jgi:hypothetical protein